MTTFGKILRNTGMVILVTINIVVCLSMLVSAYAGMLNPADNGWAGIAVLTMPICFAALIVTLLIDLCAHWRLAAAPLLTIIATLGPVYSVAPVTIDQPSAPDGAPRFTLLTYNVGNFYYGKQPGDSLNTTLQYIIDSDPDIVCIQEDIAQYGLKYAYSQLADNQLDTLHARYPYHYESEHGQTLMSRFEAFPLEERQYASVYRLTIDGRHLTLINVHLQSFNLSADDRELYNDLSTLRKPELNTRATVSTVRHELLDKVANAYRLRGAQADMLVGLIKKYGGPNVILTGDFNDVPGCYTLRRLEDCGLRQVYQAIGNGYRHTYHENHMYFRIDHMLWRGSLQPLSLSCDHLPYSDHYPQLATFALLPDE